MPNTPALTATPFWYHASVTSWSLLLLPGLFLAACSPPRSPAASRASGDWSFQVSAAPGARELSVVADLAPGSGDQLGVEPGAEPFVQDVQLLTSSGWASLPPRGASWIAPACRSGCRLRYRFQLAQAAQALDDIERASALHGAVFAPPSTWLLRPTQQPGVGTWRLRVDGDLPFLSGLLLGGAGFEAATDDLEAAPYSAFGRFSTRTLAFEGGMLELAFLEGTFDRAEQGRIEGWVRRSGEAVGGLYRRFPVPRALIFVLPSEQEGVGFGRTLGNGGASILVGVGKPVREAELRQDWVMPHELLHLAFPSVPAHQSWIEEGLSTYLEPVARVRAGQLREEEMWRDFAMSMPQGQPDEGDRGLDRTPTWGRTYWGGAIFCLLADVEIRRRTSGERSLLDALRAINEAGGNVMRRWTLERALELGDRATGTTVLKDLHREHGERPVRVDLEALWRSLGVELRGGRVVLEDEAPLAWVRRGISRQP